MGTALGLSLFASIATSEINIGPSIDWLCECMPHIALVEVRLPSSLPDPSRIRPLSHAPAGTIRVLKGHPPDSTTVDCWNGVRLRPGETASILVFFDAAREVKYAIAFHDSESCDDAIAPDFRVLRNEKEVLEIVSSRLRRMQHDRHPPPRMPLIVAVPDTTRAFQVLWSGSAVFLEVPPDPEYYPILLRKIGSPQWEIRATAAMLLGAYPGARSATALRPLLKDHAVDSLVYDDGKGRRTATPRYPVREAAYQALRQIGIDVPPPMGHWERLTPRLPIDDPGGILQP